MQDAEPQTKRARTVLIAVGDRVRGLAADIDDLHSNDGAILSEPEDAVDIFKKLNGCEFVILYGEGESNKKKAIEIANSIVSVAGIELKPLSDDGESRWCPARIKLIEITSKVQTLKYDHIYRYNGFVWFDPPEDLSTPPGEKYEDPAAKVDKDDVAEVDELAPGEKLSHLKRKKTSQILARRRALKAKDVKPPGYVKRWEKAADNSEDITFGELGVLRKIRCHLLNPYALECWPGLKSIRSKSTRKAWIRNRDSLEGKGWIVVEKFGPGTSPIIYIVIPGESCPSKHAPRQNLGQKDTS